MSGARGGDDSRDATRRTWRDDLSSVAHSAEEEVSGHGAARRITVAQQPASTPPDFVVARQRKTCQQKIRSIPRQRGERIFDALGVGLRREIDGGPGGKPQEILRQETRRPKAV